MAICIWDRLFDSLLESKTGCPMGKCLSIHKVLCHLVSSNLVCILSMKVGVPWHVCWTLWPWNSCGTCQWYWRCHLQIWHALSTRGVDVHLNTFCTALSQRLMQYIAVVFQSSPYSTLYTVPGQCCKINLFTKVTPIWLGLLCLSQGVEYLQK